ncbi:hypothetical protein CYD53_116131 [Bosea psychrotolerans]|uniref:Uncharacterized protein n=1 Tax=Bosea psychrotolerans TaxID=1871628 RepID=A0A2S4M053_9HYPH|nr:hypothetical protein CYD53_116131 [Bosea psychrotolerans]
MSGRWCSWYSICFGVRRVDIRFSRPLCLYFHGLITVWRHFRSGRVLDDLVRPSWAGVLAMANGPRASHLVIGISSAASRADRPTFSCSPFYRKLNGILGVVGRRLRRRQAAKIYRGVFAHSRFAALVFSVHSLGASRIPVLPACGGFEGLHSLCLELSGDGLLRPEAERCSKRPAMGVAGDVLDPAPLSLRARPAYSPRAAADEPAGLVGQADRAALTAAWRQPPRDNPAWLTAATATRGRER